MRTHSLSEASKRNSTVTSQNKPKIFFSPLTVQAKTDENADKDSTAQEKFWAGSIKGYLGEHPVAYHTLNNYSSNAFRYKLRIKNNGYCLLSLETQYEYKTSGLQRAWTAGSAQRGETFEVINGLPPHSSLHLKLFGERDYTDPEQSYCEGTAEAELQK